MSTAIYMRQGSTASNTTKQETSMNKQQIPTSNTNSIKKNKVIKQET